MLGAPGATFRAPAVWQASALVPVPVVRSKKLAVRPEFQ
jgi:hypothetical protein